MSLFCSEGKLQHFDSSAEHTSIQPLHRIFKSGEPCELQIQHSVVNTVTESQKKEKKINQCSELGDSAGRGAYSSVCRRWARAAGHYGGAEGHKAEESISCLSPCFQEKFTKADHVSECGDCVTTHNKASAHKHTAGIERDGSLSAKANSHVEMSDSGEKFTLFTLMFCKEREHQKKKTLMQGCLLRNDAGIIRLILWSVKLSFLQLKNKLSLENLETIQSTERKHQDQPGVTFSRIFRITAALRLINECSNKEISLKATRINTFNFCQRC